METTTLVSAAATVEDVRKFIESLKVDMPEVFRPRRKTPETLGTAASPVDYPLGRVSTPESKGAVESRSPEGGTELPFQGGKIYLTTDVGPRSTVVEEDGGIRLLLSEDESTVPHEFVREWYLKKAWEQLTASSQRWSAAMELKYRNIRVKDQKSLWGSCTSDGDLNFNWRLILAPPPILEYVVVHELAHLRELNHSKRFWSVVAAWCPDYEQRRSWLRKNEKDLRWDPARLGLN